MTATSKPLSKRIIVILVGLLAAAALGTHSQTALAASGGQVGATCYSDGYIVVSDGGNVQPQPRMYNLQIAYKTAQGWKWQSYGWRSLNGSSFRLNTTKGSTYYLHVTIATKTDSGYTYERTWVSVENVSVSPIGAVSITSRTQGLCKT
jgi:hypothetical protein